MIVEFIRAKQGALQINPHEAIRLMNHQNATVIDLRTHDAYSTGHIVNAISIPFPDFEKLKKWDKYQSNPVILVCANGLESRKAAHLLLKQQIKPYVLAGGIRGWLNAEMPLVKG
jgi:rhodanese-related sulfurtransferase